MRRRNCPPYFFTNNQLNSAVRALPTWRYPVGEGANRRRWFIAESSLTKVRMRKKPAGAGSFGLQALQPLQAGREGFEPSIRCNPYVGLANRCLQPLGHLPEHRHCATE